jgi:hypothetical protein
MGCSCRRSDAIKCCQIECADVKEKPGLLAAIRDVILAILHDPMLVAPAAVTIGLALVAAVGLALWWK